MSHSVWKPLHIKKKKKKKGGKKSHVLKVS